MKTLLRRGWCQHLLCLLSLIILIPTIGLLIRVQVLAVGDEGPGFRVSEGDTFDLEYTQSMYGVPVRERFRVEKGSFTLFHVVSTGAALEYLGIEGRREDNVKRRTTGFSVPEGSIGGHVLHVKGRMVSLNKVNGDNGHITIKLERKPLLAFLISCIRR